ncbi:MAG: cysteine methyltransferase [Betaproteobacteria bacterium HGW-Betaproteobacteria-22]|nr:MAG: cysteine methyltransferase [Betaproteobacteria bacterium HGW-Betaproteobacteria-22]
MASYSLTVDDALIDAPFGRVAVVVHGRQLAIELLGPAGQLTHSPIRLEKQSTHPLVNLACQQVMHYLQQPDAHFSLPLAQQGTPFQQRVWQAIAAIPCGQTRTYGQLAHQLGSGPRAVANACGANQLPLLVPCHRVVAQSGIGGFMQGKQGGLLIKKWLLRHEGVKGYRGE